MLPEDILAEVEIDVQIDRLRATNARLARQLDDAKAKKDDLIRAVYQAASDALGGLHLAPVAVPAPDPRRKDAETAVVLVSDLQLGKTTPTYDSQICAARMRRYATKVRELVGIQRSDHPVREVRVYLLGDLIEGEMIFPGQSHRVDASLFRQVLLDGPQILGEFLRSLASAFETVRVVGVIGNHGSLGGRSRREYHPESNADAMLYEVTRQVLATDKRITWAPTYTEGERHWFAVDRIGDHSFLLFHGDQVQGGMLGFPWYGFGRRLQGWRNGAIGTDFDYAVCGHFHTPCRLFVNTITLWANGSAESGNTYAAENLAASGRPCQWLLFSHPERGVTAEYLVDLT